MIPPDPGPINYEEALVPPYTLPDPLTFADGRPVRTPADWRPRRAELLDLFTRTVYGPTAPPPVRAPAVDADVWAPAFDGRALRVQLRFAPVDDGSPIDVLVILPRGEGGLSGGRRPEAAPVILGLNFYGNHTVTTDPGVRMGDPRVPGLVAKDRGALAYRWPIDECISAGFALATACYGDIFPDYPRGGSDEVICPGRPGAIAAWAWGLSRILDVLAMLPGLAANRVFLAGHSRLGKAALWAAARDERFAGVISNQSGCGGAALSRRRFGETLRAVTARFPHWFAPSFACFADREEDLPVDQHELLALVAPRPLCVGSADADLWADPEGERLALEAARPVYGLLGAEDRIDYFRRPGGHDLTPEDWRHYLAFLQRNLRTS